MHNDVVEHIFYV